MTDKEFFDKNLTLSFEFSRYLLAHPEIEAQIPKGALVALLLEDDSKFNQKAIELARSNREEDQPIVIVKVEKLSPPLESRLVNPHLEIASSI